MLLASMAAGMPWDWVTFPEFLDSVERTPKAVNILPYVPVGTLLGALVDAGRAFREQGTAAGRRARGARCGAAEDGLRGARRGQGRRAGLRVLDTPAIVAAHAGGLTDCGAAWRPP